MKTRKVYNHIAVWQTDNDGEKIKHFLDDFALNPNEYNAEDNAAALAYMLMYGMPGSTLDVIFHAIEIEIQAMLDSPENIEILKSRYDIENRIRCVLNPLANKIAHKGES